MVNILSGELAGYKGEALAILKKAGVHIGDIVKITRIKEVFTGVLMPRYELTDNKHIVIKLENGYNVGVKISQKTKIKKLGVGAKPAFSPPSPPKKKRGLPEVAIISTGGTIASRVDYRTGAVHPAISASDLYSVVPELSDIAQVNAEILFSLYSENILANHWSSMAKSVIKYFEKRVRGVVICHGTDTMAYSAAALSFALHNLPGPVVFVGSQRSSDRPSSDAAMNLVNAVTAACYAPFAEVVVCMHESTSDTTTLIHRGTRVRKCHTSRRDAFKSITTKPIARVEKKTIALLTNIYNKRDEQKKPILKPDFCDKVALVKFHPNFNPAVLEWYMDEGVRGIVLEGTGLGHVGKYVLPSLKRIERGAIVGMSSQCIWGRVNMNVYDVGRDLQNIGVIPLEDMIPETALIKMSWALGQTEDVEEAKRILLTNFAGEMTNKTRFTE
jgi:glutamyl-tRNA(Gln) amidotransferase subunit D